MCVYIKYRLISSYKVFGTVSVMRCSGVCSCFQQLGDTEDSGHRGCDAVSVDELLI